MLAEDTPWGAPSSTPSLNDEGIVETKMGKNAAVADNLEHDDRNEIKKYLGSLFCYIISTLSA
jgi:hypothetical protein